jgi:hypothetical protein
MMVKQPGAWPERRGPARRTSARDAPGGSARVPEQPAAEAPTTDHTTCGWCRRRIARHQEQFAVLWDSSAIHPTEAGMDGRRLVAACGAEHVAMLRATARPWIDEELWAGRLARAERGRHGRPEPRHALARRAGITIEQMQRALAWRQVHPGPGHHG